MFSVLDPSNIQIMDERCIPRPLMITDYAGQKWRLLTAPLEGMFWLPVVTGSLIYKYIAQGAVAAKAFAQKAFAITVDTSSLIATTWFLGDEGVYKPEETHSYFKQIVNFAYKDVTMVHGMDRLDGGELEEVERPFKFYEKGLTQAIAAFVLVPVLLVIGVWTTMGCSHPVL